MRLKHYLESEAWNEPKCNATKADWRVKSNGGLEQKWQSQSLHAEEDQRKQDIDGNEKKSKLVRINSRKLTECWRNAFDGCDEIRSVIMVQIPTHRYFAPKNKNTCVITDNDPSSRLGVVDVFAMSSQSKRPDMCQQQASKKQITGRRK